jgi:hypothetical protein
MPSLQAAADWHCRELIGIAIHNLVDGFGMPLNYAML